MIMSGRLRIRSMKTPAGIARKTNGRTAAARSRATSSALACRTKSAASGSASTLTLDPSWLTAFAVQSLTKPRSRQRSLRGRKLGVRSCGTCEWCRRLDEPPGSVGLHHRRLVDRRRDLLDRADGGEHDGQEGDDAADCADPEGRPQRRPLAERAAEEAPERDRSPDDPPHRRVHATLQARRADRLPVAHLRDVVDHAAEADREHPDEEERHGIAAVCERESETRDRVEQGARPDRAPDPSDEALVTRRHHGADDRADPETG